MIRSLIALSVVLAWSMGVGSHAPQEPAPRKTGLDLAAIDRSVRPQDDLYRFVNGGWLDTTDIPPDRVTWGTFPELIERSQTSVRAIVEEAAARPRPRNGSPAQQVGDLYASMIDEAAIEALGAGPMQADLRRIDDIATSRELAAEAGYLSSIAAGGPFSGQVTVDAFNPSARIVHIGQGGTLLPEREYYFKQDPASVGIRDQYVAYLTTLFTLIGRPRAAAEAAAVLAFETEVARGQWTVVDSRRPMTSASRFSLSRMRAEMPGFDWDAWAKPMGLERAKELLLREPSFFKNFAAIVAITPIGTLKAWLRARYITALSIYVSKPFNDARFDFFGRVLTGQEIPIVRWRRGVSLVNGSLGDSVGRLYVERYFPPSAKVRVEAMAARIVQAFRAVLDGSDWLTPQTKRRALDKLSKLTIKVGYPERWRDYGRLTIKRNDLFGNVRRINAFQTEYRMSRLAELTDSREWLMTPQAVNAYYAPAFNEIVLPAGILQPPLFDADADDAENYGAIGAVLGHEVGHGFDEQGRKSDGRGDVRDWWSAEDVDRFQRRVASLVGQFNAYSPIPGTRVNGELTRIENVGDLGGLSVAYRAYRLSLEGKPSPVVGGFSGEQRFFMSWARVWRSKERDEYLRQWLLTNSYAPARYRTNGPVSNLREFYDAFDVKPGDQLYRPPEQRVRIW